MCRTFPDCRYITCMCCKIMNCIRCNKILKCRISLYQRRASERLKVQAFTFKRRATSKVTTYCSDPVANACNFTKAITSIRKVHKRGNGVKQHEHAVIEKSLNTYSHVMRTTSHMQPAALEIPNEPFRLPSSIQRFMVDSKLHKNGMCSRWGPPSTPGVTDQ
jgi:hypothetical protein